MISGAYDRFALQDCIPHNVGWENGSGGKLNVMLREGTVPPCFAYDKCTSDKLDARSYCMDVYEGADQKKAANNCFLGSVTFKNKSLDWNNLRVKFEMRADMLLWCSIVSNDESIVSVAVTTNDEHFRLPADVRMKIETESAQVLEAAEVG